jgi:DNA-binding MarR family transcriptional regulator
MATAGRVRARKAVGATKKAKPVDAARGARPGSKSAIDGGKLAGLLGFHVRRAQLWVFQSFIRLLVPLELRPAEYAVLCVIEANLGLSQMALSHALGIERANIVRLLDRLENRSLVKRAPSLLDRRLHALELTGHGRSILSQAHVLVSEHEELLARRIGIDDYPAIKQAFQEFKSG